TACPPRGHGLGRRQAKTRRAGRPLRHNDAGCVRMTFMKLTRTILCSIVVAVSVAAPAFAALGGDATSVQSDLARMKGALRTTSTAGFTVHEITTSYGTVVREYLTPADKVFAVSWHGPVIPDLRQMLGRYYGQYEQAASGGGGYGRGTTTPPPPTQMIATPGPPNVETLTVDAGPTGGVNTAFVSVQICVPGTMTCQTIDHIEVDTGSTGLRILGDVPFTLTLPQATNGSGGPPMTECLQFADGPSYGTLRVADITLPGSGEHAANVVVQLIGDSTYPVPAGTITGQSACPGIAENSVPAFGANGILGVGPFAQDCGGGCAAPNPPLAGVYYNCASPSTCVDANASLAQQVPNPVTLFATDNNGVIVELPAVGSAGTTTATGS